VVSVSILDISRVPNERLVPVSVLSIPLGELFDPFTDRSGRLVADEFVGLRNIGVGVLGVGVTGLVVFQF